MLFSSYFHIYILFLGIPDEYFEDAQYESSGMCRKHNVTHVVQDLSVVVQVFLTRPMTGNKAVLISDDYWDFHLF